MKKNEAFPSTYLSKEDIKSPLVLTIDNIQMETIQSEHGEEDKPVVRFREAMKPLILNGTNWDLCEDAFGNDSDNWCGRAIEMYVDSKVKFKGKTVGGIRCRLPGEKGQSATVGDSVAGTGPEEREGRELPASSGTAVPF